MEPTISGGTNTDGTLFEITPQGVFTSLHSFAKSDGADPFAALVQDTDGSFMEQLLSAARRITALSFAWT